MSVGPFARAVTLAAASIVLLGSGVGGSGLAAPGSHVVRTALLAVLTPSAAFGQEVMEFKPVPAESLTQLERRPRRAERAAPAPPATSAPPALPAEPSEPDAPEAPELSRSGHMMRIGSDVHVEKDQVVDGDVFSLRGDVRVDGHVKGNVAATGGDVYLSSTARVDGDVVCIGGQLHEESGASVGGQRVTALRGGEGHRISRRVRDRIRGLDPGDHERAERAGDLVGSIVWLLFWLGAAWMVTKFAPVRTETALDTVRREPGMSLLVGFITALLVAPSLVALALVMAILCITIIGIPLAIGAILGYIGLLIVVTGWGFLVAVIPVGRHVGSRLGAGSPALGAAGAPQSLPLMRAAIYGVLATVGLCVIANFLDYLPFLGWMSKLVGVIYWVASSVLVMIGAGALIRSKFGQGPGGQWWPIRRTAVPVTPTAPAAPAPAAPVPAASDQTWTGGQPAGGLESSPPTG